MTWGYFREYVHRQIFLNLFNLCTVFCLVYDHICIHDETGRQRPSICMLIREKSYARFICFSNRISLLGKSGSKTLSSDLANTIRRCEVGSQRNSLVQSPEHLCTNWSLYSSGSTHRKNSSSSLQNPSTRVDRGLAPPAHFRMSLGRKFTKSLIIKFTDSSRSRPLGFEKMSRKISSLFVFDRSSF